MYKKAVLIWGILVLIVLNGIIFQREGILQRGDVVLLKLAPADPRSLMQGDYMALRYEAQRRIEVLMTRNRAETGYAVFSVDDNREGTFLRIYRGELLSEEEIKIRYRWRDNQVLFATNGWFFQEGHGKYYEGAAWGEFRVSPRGEVLLTGLRGDDLKPLGPRE